MVNSLLYINQGASRLDFAWLKPLDKILQKKFKLKQAISLALVSPQTIKKLNKLYRRHDQVTDVLSFNLDSQQVLGEVVICLAVAKRQAKIHQHSLTTELKILTIHGCLHLLGYDHERSVKEYQRQMKMEDSILKILNK